MITSGRAAASDSSATWPFSRLGYLPADRLERETHAAPHHVVVVDQQDPAGGEPQMLRNASMSLPRSTGLTR